ncbi:MAG TPA: choice-of-anchor D domain-containing protein [Micromonosporaceae bacterium]
MVRTTVRRRRCTLLTVMALVATSCALVLPPPTRASADVQTAGVDNLRTDWDPAEPGLSPADVLGSDFGQLFATQLDGQVYAQPLVVGNMVIANTENDQVYGLSASDGHIIWSRDLGPAWPAATVGCGDLTPNIGSTATSTYDAATNTVYVTTKVNDGADAKHPTWYLHALDASTGTERTGWPVPIVGTPANDPFHPFAAENVNERPGLLLTGGAVYLAFGAQCDIGKYVGWVAGVNTTTRTVNLWSDEVGASSSESGIWQAGGGLVSDGPGRIFLTTGNGVTAPDAPGSTPPQQLSQSVVRLGVDSNGAISAQDFFSPTDAATLDLNDADLGAGGPVALPDQYFGTPAVPQLLVEIGKDGRLFLLDRDHLGGKGQGKGDTNDVVQTLGPYKGVWGHPAVYGGEGGYVYLVQNSGAMLAFKYGTDGSGNPALSLAGNTAETFGYTSGSPLVTSDGVAPGSALVWVVRTDGPTGANGQLCAYNGVPANGTMHLLRCFPIGTAAKFSTPSASAGRLYVGTRDGMLYGIGQPASPALSIPQTNFGGVAVGKSATATIVATANRTVTVTAMSTTAPFSLAAPKLPVTLTAGQALHIPATFAPTEPGSTTGVATLSVTDGTKPVTLGSALQGTAVQPGFSAQPATLAFGDVAVGSTKALTAGFTNTGATNERISAVTGPGAPFQAGALPTVGTTVAPGQTVAVSVSFAPAKTGAVTATMKVAGPDGTGTATLTANGVTGHKQLSITPASIPFGTVPVGASTTKVLTVANTGNLNVTITKAAPPGPPFVVHTPIPEGQVLTPGDSLQVPVTYAPTATGAAKGSYLINADDGNGQRTIALTGTGAKVAGTSLPSPAAGGWAVNGSAAMTSSVLTLTGAVSGERGSGVFTAPVPSDGLTASFTAGLGGGTGADGMTFALLDASVNGPTALGGGGGGLGFSGLKGVAVSLDTYQDPGDPSANFVGLSSGGSSGNLTYVKTSTNVPDLRTGTHTVAVTVSSGTVTVRIDGASVLSAAMPVAPSVLPAFTAATGGLADAHSVSDVTISSGSTRLPPPGTGWRFNGTTVMNGATAVLTPAATNAAGSMLYAEPVRTDGLRATFDLRMSGGTGADGATFDLVDPAQGAAALGGGGSGLGFGGLGGVAVAFVTYPQNGIASNNFAGIMTGTAGGTPAFVATNTSIADLRTGSHAVGVTISGSVVTVTLDGKQILRSTVPALGRTALVGYSAGTGAATDVHAVTDASIVTSGVVAPPQMGGWHANGVAQTVGPAARLTGTADYTAGSIVDPTAIPTAHLDAHFTIGIGGGNGADGLTFALLDPATAGATALGSNGSGLGFAGLGGVAVAFVTYPQSGVASSNFVGVLAGKAKGAATFGATTTRVPPLRTGTHAVEVYTGASGHLVVAVDGATVLDTAVTLPVTALPTFTGATGGLNDAHTVSDIGIAY